MGILALWFAASATGTVGQFEDLMRSIGFRDFAVSGTRVALGLILIAAAITLLATALAVIAAGLYNALAATGHRLRSASHPTTRRRYSTPLRMATSRMPPWW